MFNTVSTYPCFVLRLLDYSDVLPWPPATAASRNAPTSSSLVVLLQQILDCTSNPSPVSVAPKECLRL
jgi:hypothetical protein